MCRLVGWTNFSTRGLVRPARQVPQQNTYTTLFQHQCGVWDPSFPELQRKMIKDWHINSYIYFLHVTLPRTNGTWQIAGNTRALIDLNTVQVKQSREKAVAVDNTTYQKIVRRNAGRRPKLIQQKHMLNESISNKIGSSINKN